MSEGTQRKLAAIVVADVAGYSRLMGADEDGTLAALKAHRAEMIDPAISRHGGRIVKTTGDGLLLEFASAVDAVECCLAVQQGMQQRNAAVPEEHRIRFRVGVNLGDIIVDGDDIFGDGVNVAARLEAMAPAGGICLSAAVVDQVQRRLDLELEDLGERALKNIEAPVHAYRVARVGGSATSAGKVAVPNVDAGFSLPERPAIIILPFRNLNGDSENDFIADGIGLGIQTLLVQLSGIFLVNANADQGYRAGTKSAAEVARNLPVRYALEGNAQRAGQRVRVTVQLTDLKDGTVIWAERYDRELEDVFALQDDVTREVISSLNVQLFRRDLDRILTYEFSGDGAWEFFLRGVSHLYKFNREDNEKARFMFERLYAMRPEQVQGPGYIALTHWLDATRGWSESRADSLVRADEYASRAVGYADNDGLGHVIMSWLKLQDGQYDEALALCERAVEFRPSCPAALGQIAAVQLYCGETARAITSAREAMNVRTMYPPMLVNTLATAYRDNGEIDLSILAAKEAVRLDPNFVDGLATLCSDHVLAGDEAEARRVAAEIIGLNPGFLVSEFAKKHPYRNPAKLETLIKALRAAELPE